MKILTYNLFLRPLFVKNKKSDYKKERLEAFKTHLGDFDIFCSQEAFVGLTSHKATLVKYGAELGFDYIVTPTLPGFFSRALIDSGLIIMSWYPVLETDEIVFSKFLKSDALARKGALYAKIEVSPGRHLHLFNSHTQANYFDSSFAMFRDSIALKLG